MSTSPRSAVVSKALDKVEDRAPAFLDLFRFERNNFCRPVTRRLVEGYEGHMINKIDKKRRSKDLIGLLGRILTPCL